MAATFRLEGPYQPAGDQPKAIEQLVNGYRGGKSFQVLLGATGTGKTFTASNVIAALGKPTLVLAHNKTLAAQLYKEFRGFFPHNAVHYFVSYYDYYQPEAYIPQRDIYIEKDSSINENIDRLRLAATSALVSREDVIIVASVSCIYGLGSPSDYKRMMVYLQKGEVVDRDNLLLRLVDIQYRRNDVAFERGTFRVRGDTIDVWPASEEAALRIELFGDEVDSLAVIHPVSGETIKPLEELYVYPAKHFVTPEERVRDAIKGIEQELQQRLEQFKTEGKLLEAERLKARCRYDLDMLREVGYCSGIENYARWFSGRQPGEPPYTLMDFFPEDFLVVVDESHVSLPQVRGMFHGDYSRKTTLVEHGFRLPSALDNRPLRFEEFEQKLKTCLCLSATPGPYELEKVGGEVVEQVIRPTGLVDPVIHIKPARGQVADLAAEITKRTERGERTLVTTLTKRMAEDLTTYFRDAGMKCAWLHSELDAIERIAVLRELREGQFDVLVGVNLLREGLDLPEVSLVAILDADKEGFLRSETSLIQTIGRAARNVNAEVVLYADTVTDSMSRAVAETNRRRDLQLKYNAEHGITPATVKTAIKNAIEEEIEAHQLAQEAATGSSVAAADDYVTFEYVQQLFQEMMEAAKGLDFERAQLLRDQIVKLEAELEKKYGEAAAPSVLGGKAVAPGLPVPKKRGKGGKKGRAPRPWEGTGKREPKTPEEPRPLTAKEIVKMYSPSVARIVTPNIVGSGFVVEPGLVVTNAHVVDGEAAHDIRVVFPSGPRPGEELSAILLHQDSEKDLAVFRVDNPPPALPLATSVERGEDLVVIGSPGTTPGAVSDNSVTTGVLSNDNVQIDGLRYYQISAPINPGNSGGPVFNTRGEVVGVATWFLRDRQQMNYIVPFKDVRETLRKATSR